MIVHESRNAAFRRPFGAAEVCARLYLAAERQGAESMTLRLHTFSGEDRLLPMDREADGRFSLTFSAPETPCVLWYSFLAGGEETSVWQITVYDPAPVPEWWKNAVVYQIFPDRFARESGWEPRDPTASCSGTGTRRYSIPGPRTTPSAPGPSGAAPSRGSKRSCRICAPWA